MTEVWFRNPHTYVKELAEVGGKQLVAWDRGLLVKRRIEPVAHAKLYFGVDNDFEILCIGAQGTAHLDKDHTLDNPKAVYPTWEYGEKFAILEEMVESPIGDDPSIIDLDLPPDQKPVPGQRHMVVITNPPNVNLAAHRPFYRQLRELQEEFSNCIIYLHGSYSYRTMFGMGLGAADVDPRTSAAKGRVDLPNGKQVSFASTMSYPQWINLLGMSVVELKIPRNRCMFNIKSAKWCGENFNSTDNFKTRGSVDVDPDSPRTIIPVTAATGRTGKDLQEGDKITCDTCSLGDTCKQFRDGAVCSVNGSETSALAKMFQSRDGSKIIDGLGTILAAQTTRLERGMREEEDFGELDPEITKMMNALFANGVKLAKLVDPTLTKPMVQINNGSTGSVAQANPKQLTAEVVRALEDSGVKREDITAEMFEMMLVKMTGGVQAPVAIEGSIVGG